MRRLAWQVRGISDRMWDAKRVLNWLAGSFAGFAGDLFLKRAFLFINMLHLKFGMFDESEISSWPIPADYQVPNVMRTLGMLCYSPELAGMIKQGTQIPRMSGMEVEIRAATVIVGKMLHEASGLSTARIDASLWSMRKACHFPHHLTVTTDY